MRKESALGKRVQKQRTSDNIGIKEFAKLHIKKPTKIHQTKIPTFNGPTHQFRINIGADLTPMLFSYQNANALKLPLKSTKKILHVQV